MLDDSLVLSLTATSEPSACAITGRAFPEQPLTVPDDGIYVWELQGGQTVSLDFTLPEQHTVALWLKLLPARDRESGAILAGDGGTQWLSLGPDTLHGAALPPAASEQWFLAVLRGETSTNTSALCAWAGDPLPQCVGGTIKIQSGALLDTLGDAEASLGAAESLCVWSRQLSAAELRKFWVSGCARLGLPEPPLWIDLDAPPPRDTLRLVGTVVETFGGAPLADVTVSASFAGALPASALATSTAEDGTFLIEIPTAMSADGAMDGAVATVVVSLTQAGFAPQTVVGAASGGEELRFPAARLTRLSAQVTFNATSGGVVRDDRTHTVFSVPPSAFLNADGSVFAGAVTVSTATIDPSDEAALASMPGDFSAIDVDGHAGALRSFGAYYFSATDDSGVELGLNPDAPVSVEWPLSVPLDTCEKGVLPPSAWSFDAGTGKWMQHGGATLEVDGVRLPAPGSAEFIALGQPELPPAEAPRAPPPRKKGNKAKGNQAGTAAIVDAVRAILEGRKSLKSLKQLHIRFGGWCNIDSMLSRPSELPCLLRGRLAGWAAASAAWHAKQIVAVGVDYASRTCARVLMDGAFELAVQPDSVVKLQVEVQGPSCRGGAPKKLCEIADVQTGEALSAKDLGDLPL